MATKPSITDLRRGASALTAEAGKLVRDRALSAAHQALVLALQSVQAADRKLRGTGTGTRRKATRRAPAAAAVKRKLARPATKTGRTVAAARRGKAVVRRGRAAAH